jgi:hypothetical protein
MKIWYVDLLGEYDGEGILSQTDSSAGFILMSFDSEELHSWTKVHAEVYY